MAVTAGVVALFEVDTLIDSLRVHSQLRQMLIDRTNATAAGLRPAVAERLRPGSEAAWDQVALDVQGAARAAEVELLDAATAASLHARPQPPPVRHWPDARQLANLRSGAALTFGPFFDNGPRLLSYVSAVSGGRDVVVRFSTAIPEVAAFVDERRRLLLAHGAAIALLLAAAVIALRPAPGAEPLHPPGVLEAYEQAMERLRDHAQALTRDHQAERRRMEGEIRDKEALARSGELAAGITHEVRNGLATILGFARLLEQSAATSEQAEAARGIRQECQAIETVVRRLLDYVKSETLHPTSFDLTRLLKRVSARESRGHPDTEVSLLGGEAAIVGDEELLERAFENLVRNALEAAPPGGHVWITAASDDTHVGVVVADDGPGMSAEALAQLRPFYTTKPSGTGLGLALALKIVLLHQGELKLRPRSPRGLEVAVRLPAAGPR